MAREQGPSRDSKAYREFLAEAEEMLERLRSDWADFEDQKHAGGEIDPVLINGLFRSAHSLKGLSGMFGIDGITELAHHLEDVLDSLRLGRLSANSPQSELIGEVVRLFGTVMSNLGDESEAAHMDDAIRELIIRLDAATGSDEEDEDESLPRLQLDPTLMRALTEYEEHRLFENLRRRKNKDDGDQTEKRPGFGAEEIPGDQVEENEELEEGL